MNNIKIVEVCLWIHWYSRLYLNLMNMPGFLFTARRHAVVRNICLDVLELLSALQENYRE